MSVGLDIGYRTVKVVELSPDGGKYSLRAAGAISYQGLEIEKVQDERALSQLSGVIKKLFSDARISSKDVNIALPEQLVFTRLLKFPLLTDQEIASAVKWESEEYIPIPIKDAVIQHQILERRENASPPQVLVLIIAVQRTVVDTYLNLCKLAGLNILSVETEPMALSRSLAPVDRSAVIVDMGARSTDIAIVKNEQLYFARSISTAGDAFTRAVSQGLAISPAQAEEYKKTYGLGEEMQGKIATAITPVIRTVAEEIKKAIHYYTMDVNTEQPSEIILAGGTANLPGVVSYMTELLGTEVSLANAFAKVSVDADSMKNLADYTPFYPIATGLALKNE